MVVWINKSTTLSLHGLIFSLGHTDCVRGLALLTANEFLSCSNDATIRRWSLSSSSSLQVYYGHSNYIYSLAVLPNGQDFVSVGEDRSLRVWRGEDCVASLVHPCDSVWCVAVLPCGDIITGGSDGVLRIFTNTEERYAEESMLKMFDDEVKSSKLPMPGGDMKNLASPEALQQPGN